MARFGQMVSLSLRKFVEANNLWLASASKVLRISAEL